MYSTKKDNAAIISFQDYTPKHPEPPHYKAHHDFMMDEMEYMAIDFDEEHKYKKAMAYKLSHHAAEVARRRQARTGKEDITKRVLALKLVSMV